jgi:hypothetical protein
MSGRLNWSRVSSLKRMRRQGVEDIQGGTPLSIRIPQQRPQIIATPRTKAELRREAAKAFMAWRARRGQS